MYLDDSSEPVQTVANCNVDSLPKYSVSPLRVCDNLHRKTGARVLILSVPNKLDSMYHAVTHLCVPSTDIKNSGVVGFCDESAHFNVSNAVVDPEQRLSPKLCDCTSHQSHCHQGGTHTRS